MKRSFPTPRNRAVRMRHMRRRLYLQDGVLSVRFIKFINEQPAPAPMPEPVGMCPRCNGRLYWTDDDHDAVRCSACQHLMVAAKNIRAASERMQAEQPPAVGAALPEPKPELPPDSAKCIGCYAIFTRGFKSVEGTGFCDNCIRALCPQPEPEPEEDRCNMVGCINPCQPGYYFCKEHMAAISGMTAEEWARGLSLGGCTPPWPA